MKIGNLYEQIAELLGLEMGQKFNVISDKGGYVGFNRPYTITESGIMDVEGCKPGLHFVEGLLGGQWSCEPIAESLLTDEEKDYLETVIKYSKYPITHFGVAETGRGIYVMCQCNIDNGTSYSKNTYVNLAFKNMKINMMYTLEELGLEG